MPYEFDPRAFRRALGNFATGVTVVTAATSHGQRVGVTANSFNSVSLDPPLILWSLDKRSSSQQVFQEASHFAVNILAANQIDLSNNFARPKDDRFEGIRFEEGEGGAPVLEGCAARLHCESYQQLDGGDHWIMLGKVVRFDDYGRAPLLYHQGAYSMVLPHTQLARKDAVERPVSNFEGRLASNLYYLMTQAVRSYQASYQPRQLATGLRTSEARMLMVLEKDAGLSQRELLREVAMPQREVDEAIENLCRKGLVEQVDGHVRLTGQGIEQTEALWTIAQDQQGRIFDEFEPEVTENFKRVLLKIISR
ncbi:flavin reductase [Pseudomonas syringae]|uniref:p-hydroxyphenylacetate 3-hydroxylase reductase component n=1 Tax=Pseudomonas syringae TaxID=317 RepID=UPI00215A8D88|nr:flavin reductase [Pseudomonas syringae]MCR8718347.1 flavin reductase [Pseudomonas syringae]